MARTERRPRDVPPARFVGRTPELAQLESAIDDARAGRGSLAFVSGAAGIGKTQLAEEVVSRATAGGLQAFWGRCPSAEGIPPFWPWVQVIRAYAREHDPAALLAGMAAAEDIARLVASIPADDSPEAFAAVDADQDRFRLYDSLATFLRKVGDLRPSVVALDDLHCADGATLAFLRFLAAEVGDMRLLVLGTFRDDEISDDHALAKTLADLPRESRRVSLDGMSPTEVAELIAATTGTRPDPAVAATVHARTGGNPFFVAELAQLLGADGGLATAGVAESVPASIREVIAGHLTRVTLECRRLLSAAAVAGEEFDLDVVARVAGVEHGRARDLLDEALTAHLLVTVHQPLGRYAFAHALVREWLEADLGGAGCERLHLAVGLALEALHGDDTEPPYAELAGHFLAALPGGDREKAVTYAVRAAEQANARMAHETAAAHLTAVTELVGGERRLELLLSLGEAWHRAGDWTQASETFVAASDLARGLGRAEELARAALGLGAGLGGFEVRLFDQRQIDLLEEALAKLPPDDSALRAWVMARLSVALSFVGSEERRADLALQAVDMARRVGDPAAHAYALSTYCDTIATPDHIPKRLELTAEMVTRAAEAGDRELELLARRFRVVSLFEVGDIPGMDREIEAFARLAEVLKHPISLWYVPLFRGTRAMIEGRFAEAERFAQRAIELGNRASSQNVLMLADLTQLSEIYRQSGRFDELDRQYERMNELFPPMAAMFDWISFMRAPLGRGGEAKARAELERLAAAGSLTGMMGGGMWIVITTFLAEAAAAVRHRQAAAVLYDALRPYGEYLTVCGIAGCTYGGVARHLALLADVLELDDVERHFEEALEVHSRTGALPYLAHTQREYAAMLLRTGREDDRQRATTLLDAAKDTYRQLGMDPYLAMAEALTAPDAGEDNAFRCEGEFWAVAFANRTVRLRDNKGMRDIALLLRSAGREVHVSDVIAASEGVAADPRVEAVRAMSAQGRNEAGLGGGGTDAGEVLDEAAKSAYKARIAELQEEVDEADRWGEPERAAAAKAELDFITGELAAAYGLGGRARRAGDPGERARKTVTQRIRRTIKSIGLEHPALARHLDNSIKTGLFCSYQPESPVDWSL